MCKFDLTKPVQTREGKPARIVSTNMAGRYPVLAIIDEGEHGDHAARYTLKGRFMTAPGETALDLVNVPEEREQFFNVYLNDGMLFGPKMSAEEADEDARPDRSFTLRLLRQGDTVVGAELVDA